MMPLGLVGVVGVVGVVCVSVVCDGGETFAISGPNSRRTCSPTAPATTVSSPKRPLDITASTKLGEVRSTSDAVKSSHLRAGLVNWLRFFCDDDDDDGGGGGGGGSDDDDSASASILP